MAEMVTMNITPPFFADNHGDILIFRTLDGMASEVEAIDVRNREYEFYDSRGQVILGAVIADRVILTPAPEEALHPERLESALRSYFARMPSRLRDYSEAAREASSLDELVRLRERLAESGTRGMKWTRRDQGPN